MKKIYSLVAVVAASVAINAQVNAFNGADFENWETFKGSLNSEFNTIKPYATQGVNKGYEGSHSLNISGNITRNEFVFTSNPASGLPASAVAITFYVKGTAGKSLSINLYKNTTDFYPFNVGNLTADKTISKAGANNYTGAINTNGEWVKVTLDVSGINDINFSNTEKSFFALKVGKDVQYDIDIDNIQVVDATMNVYDLQGNRQVQLVKNTSVENTVIFEVKSNVKIYNTNGQLVKSIAVVEGQEVNVSALPKGIYIVTGEVNGKVASQKIIKK